MMKPALTSWTTSASASARLLRLTLVVTAAYFFLMMLFWSLGVEGIYAHPTPFYAVWKPAGWMALAWSALPLAALAVFWVALSNLGALRWLVDNQTAAPRMGRVLGVVFLFLVCFACAIAMLRGGTQGIAQAYQREAYEYVGDIGKTSSIRALFERYLEVRPYLSMHAKVHPPGPIALLWLFSYGVGRDALVLSLATVLFSALAVFPLWGWLKTLYDARTALVGALLYVLVPSIVLFTATSADALFTPVTLFTLYAFDQALREDKPGWALPAGVGFACMSLLKFSLVGVGVWFALSGLLLMRRPETRMRVVRTAALMLAAAAAVHGLVWWWSGFDYWAAFQAGKAQFDTDQFNLDRFTPRYPGWTFRVFFNPMTWFYFAGIPVSLLFLRRLAVSVLYRRNNTPPPAEPLQPIITPTQTAWICLLTLLALNCLYLARGEGERSALYLFPFLVAPAADLLAGACRREGRAAPLMTAMALLAAQCWLTELLFYTYW